MNPARRSCISSTEDVIYLQMKADGLQKLVGGVSREERHKHMLEKGWWSITFMFMLFYRSNSEQQLPQQALYCEQAFSDCGEDELNFNRKWPLIEPGSWPGCRLLGRVEGKDGEKLDKYFLTCSFGVSITRAFGTNNAVFVFLINFTDVTGMEIWQWEHVSLQIRQSQRFQINSSLQVTVTYLSVFAKDFGVEADPVIRDK